MNVNTIKTFSNLQTTFMWDAVIDGYFKDDLSSDTTNTSFFKILTRETTVPGKTLKKTNWRYKGRQIGLPQGYEYEGEWTVKVQLVENGLTLKQFINWFYGMDNFDMRGGKGKEGKTNAVITLNGLDGVSKKAAYKFLGIYPLNIPGIEGLNQENSEGHITFDVKFAFDDVVHGYATDGVFTNYLERPYTSDTTKSDTPHYAAINPK